MARSHPSGGNRGGAGRGQQPPMTLAQALAQETPMKRYVHTIPTPPAPDPEEETRQLLWELTRILDHQNQILARLLQSVEGLARAAGRR